MGNAFHELTINQWEQVIEKANSTDRSDLHMFILRSWANQQSVSNASICAFREIVVEDVADRSSGSTAIGTISRFVRDVPKEFMKEVRLKNTVIRPTSFSTNSRISDSGDLTGFELGQRVSHHVYGEGVILNFEGNGPRARVHVSFEQVGTKILILASANLQSL